MVDSHNDGYNDLISNMREWNNCFIKITPKRIAIFELPSCFRRRVSDTIFVVNGIGAHIPLPAC